MGINLINLYALVMAIAGVALLLYLVPRQFRETKRPRDGFTTLRKQLFVQPLILIVLVGIRIPYFATHLSVPPRSTAAAIVGIATSTAVFFFMLNMFMTYTYKEKK